MLDFTTVQTEFIVEGVQFILDILRTGTVLAGTEIQ